MVNSKKAVGKSLTEVSVQGNVMQKSVTDGKEVAEIQMGQKAPVDAAAKEKNLFEAHFVPETMLTSLKVKATLKAIEVLAMEKMLTWWSMNFQPEKKSQIILIKNRG